MNQNNGTQFGNTNIGDDQENGGGDYKFNGMPYDFLSVNGPSLKVLTGGIPGGGGAGGGTQYGNQNTGSRSINSGGKYAFGMTPVTFMACR